MPDLNADLPISTKLTGLCTRCGDINGSFTLDHTDTLHDERYSILEPTGIDRYQETPDEQVAILICDRCQGKIMVLERYGRPAEPEPIELQDEVSEDDAKREAAPQNNRLRWWGIYWWPRAD